MCGQLAVHVVFRRARDHVFCVPIDSSIILDGAM